MKFSPHCIGLVVCAISLAAPARAQAAEAFWVHPEAHTTQAADTPLATPAARSHTPREQIVKAPKAVSKRSAPASTRITPPTPATPAQNAMKPNTDPGQLASRSIAEGLATGQSSPWAIAVGLTLLTLVPAVLLAMTPLVRLLVVFHFLRQALGTQTAPSNQILMALGLMMTWFLMQPVITQIEQQAVTPYRAGTLSGEDALARGAVPIKLYMLHYARDKDLELFASASQSTRLEHREDAPMQVVVPAYMLSELKAGFQIGAILFLPFLLIDLVVASVTTSIGMLQMPPTVISTPVKILLFVTVDGWHLLASSLLKSF